jgi:hypothetical protein
MTAEIVDVPGAMAVTRPWVPTALLIVATPVLDDAHVTVAVRSAVEPSVNVPVAVNCCFVPLAITGLTGVAAMLTSAALGCQRPRACGDRDYSLR